MLKWLFPLFFAASVIAEDPEWSFDDTQGWNSQSLAKMYFHHSETQRQWAWELLGKCPLKGDERILDFGCGDGKVTSELSRLVPKGSILGVDIAHDMLYIAKRKFPSFAYPNLEFKKCESLRLDERFDVICSFSVFQFIADPVEQLKDLKTRLNPGGKLLLVIPTNTDPALFQAANETFAKWGLAPPWSNITTAPTHSTRTIEGCTSILQQAGFEKVTLEFINTDNPFYDMQELILWLVGTGTANWNVPHSVSFEFFTDFANRLSELNPSLVDAEGQVRLSLPRIHIIAEV